MTSTYSPLLTDLYQITMAYGYWKTGADRKESVFHLFFRKNPFKGGYTIACGLEEVMDFIDAFQFSEEDLSYLKQLCGNDNGPLFEPAFIDYLRNLDFSCNVDAVEEGTIVFPHQPLLRIQGPIVECQLLETPLLNIINFQSLIATKSARIKCSAGDDPVIEFGLRRAQGPNGALGASRAAYVGGTEATSNVLAG
jgi:nicotinate phosphoribosyltransferase